MKDVYGYTNVPLAAWTVPCSSGVAFATIARAIDGFNGRFVGIDISPSAVDHCRTLGLPANFDFQVDNANELAMIPDGSVGYAFGDGVRHHLDLAMLASALARKLSPDGYARFIEPAQGNILLRAFPRLTPKMRTLDERPFDQASVELLEAHFRVAITYQALLRPLLPMLFGNAESMIRATRWLDTRLLANQRLQLQA